MGGLLEDNFVIGNGFLRKYKYPQVEKPVNAKAT